MELTDFQVLTEDGSYVLATIPATEYSFKVTKLPGAQVMISGHRYCFLVVARTADASSTPSKACERTEPVHPVRSLKATTTSSQVTVSWECPSWKPAKGSGYSYRVILRGGSGKPIARLVDITTATFTGLTPSTAYKIEVSVRWADRRAKAHSPFSKKALTSTRTSAPPASPTSIPTVTVSPPTHPCYWITPGDGTRYWYCP